MDNLSDKELEDYYRDLEADYYKQELEDIKYIDYDCLLI